MAAAAQADLAPATPARPWAEIALAAIIVGGIIYCAVFAWVNKYLPPPFFFEPNDTFADWFNPAFWAGQDGAYDTWRTIYPPLTFVFLRFFRIDRCYPDARPLEGSSGLAARDCDWLGLVMLGLIFTVNIVLTWKSFRKIDPRTAPMRTICVALGVPMLVTLERGNLLLLAFTCILLALGPLVGSARLRWLFAGLAINFKIYLVAAIIPLLLKRRWLWVECALIATALVYLLSLASFGHGTPGELFANVSEFSTQGAATILDPWSAFTYGPLISVLKTGVFPMSSIIGSVWVDRLEILLPALTIFTQLLIVMAATAIWISPQLYTPYRAVTLGVMMALMTSESGHYTLIFVALFVLMEPWRGFGRIWAITMCYILAFPFDVPLDWLPETAREVYFENTTTMISNQVTLGPFLRPLLTMTIAWAMCLTTMNEFRKAALPQYRAQRAAAAAATAPAAPPE